MPSPLQTAVPQKQDQLHRLVYRAVDGDAEGHFITVEALMEKSEPVKKDRPDAVEEESVDAELAAESEDAGKSPQGDGLEATEAEDVKATKAQDVEAAKERSWVRTVVV